MPKDLSICSLGNINYLAACLITEKGPDICLGFVSESKRVIREVTALRGFVLAAGSRGIHALQVVSEDASLSEWVGCLGVSGKVSPSVLAPKAQGSSLREAALWYPTVPEPELCLNEVSLRVKIHRGLDIDHYSGSILAVLVVATSNM
jgi:hypothetical protein